MEIKSFTVELTHLKPSVTGWGNGYIVIPKDHPLHGVHYDDIDVDVHCGLTFSDYGSRINNHAPDGVCGDDDWVIGFDTAHWQDNQENCPQSFVEQETERLRVQIESYTEMPKP